MWLELAILESPQNNSWMNKETVKAWLSQAKYFFSFSQPFETGFDPAYFGLLFISSFVAWIDASSHVGLKVKKRRAWQEPKKSLLRKRRGVRASTTKRSEMRVTYASLSLIPHFQNSTRGAEPSFFTKGDIYVGTRSSATERYSRFPATPDDSS